MLWRRVNLSIAAAAAVGFVAMAAWTRSLPKLHGAT
jgi:hypothetical protein